MLCFEAVSGLKIEFSKSELIGVRVPEDHLLALAGLMGCKAGVLPSTYLGLLLCIGAPPKYHCSSDMNSDGKARKETCSLEG